MRRIITAIIVFVIMTPLFANVSDKHRLPNTRIVSMFMKDDKVDVNGNYLVNFFIGELWAFLDSNGIEAMYEKSMDGVSKGWYMMLDFSGKTTLSSNGTYHYEYKDVGIYRMPADKSISDKGYWIYLGDFTVGTRKGDLVRYLKKHITK